jgi:hypothetical protein
MDKAIAIFERGPWYKPELARTSLLQAELCDKMGDDSGHFKSMARAEQLMAEVLQDSPLQGKPLTLQHLDRVVAPWVF